MIAMIPVLVAIISFVSKTAMVLVFMTAIIAGFMAVPSIIIMVSLPPKEVCLRFSTLNPFQLLKIANACQNTK
jgi:hypothetical protein